MNLKKVDFRLYEIRMTVFLFVLNKNAATSNRIKVITKTFILTKLFEKQNSKNDLTLIKIPQNNIPYNYKILTKTSCKLIE